VARYFWTPSNSNGNDNEVQVDIEYCGVMDKDGRWWMVVVAEVLIIVFLKVSMYRYILYCTVDYWYLVS